MLVALSVRKLKCHFYFKQFLFLFGLISIFFLVEGESDDNCFDYCAFLILETILLVGRDTNIAE